METKNYLEDDEEYLRSPKSLKRFSPKEFRKNFLKILAEDKDLLKQVIKIADFRANWHDIHDGCPSGNPQCSHCYSGDTEAEMLYDDTLANVWRQAYNLTTIHNDSEAEISDSSEDSALEYFHDAERDPNDDIEEESDKEGNDNNKE